MMFQSCLLLFSVFNFFNFFNFFHSTDNQKEQPPQEIIEEKVEAENSAAIPPPKGALAEETIVEMAPEEVTIEVEIPVVTTPPEAVLVEETIVEIAPVDVSDESETLAIPQEPEAVLVEETIVETTPLEVVIESETLAIPEVPEAVLAEDKVVEIAPVELNIESEMPFVPDTSEVIKTEESLLVVENIDLPAEPESVTISESIEVIHEEEDLASVDHKFVENSSISLATLSPDGKHIAYLKSTEGIFNIFVVDISTQIECQITTIKGTKKISHFCWGNNTRIVFEADLNFDNAFSLYAVNLDGSDFRYLMSYGKMIDCQILDALADSLENILIVPMDRMTKQSFSVYQLNIYNGHTSLIEKNPGNITRWFSGPRGEIHLAQFNDEQGQSICYRNKIGDPWVELMSYSSNERVVPVGVSRDSTKFYYLSKGNEKTLGLFSKNLQVPYSRETIFQDKKRDITSYTWSEKGSFPIGISLASDFTENYFFDYNWKALDRLMKKNYPSCHYWIASMDPKETKVLLGCSSGNMPHGYFIYHMATRTLEKVFDAYPTAPNATHYESRLVNFLMQD